jgi:DNA polymerase-3 subunit epsilon
MKNQEYAIVDIETTGGNTTQPNYRNSYRDSWWKKVIDRWETLNPQKEIPPAIFALTGITKMVSTAPVLI